MNDFFKNTSLIGMLIKWKFHLLVIVVVAATLAAFFSSSLFITPLFKSTAVLYPANVTPYSDESETEQMMQIIQSKDIKDGVIRKFNLARHYKIYSSYEHFNTVMLGEWNDKVKISKTPFESINLEVLDKDPDTACAVVKAIIDFYTLKVRELHKEKFYEVVLNFREQLDQKAKDLDSLRNLLHNLGTQYGIMEYESQSREVMRAYLRTGGTNINTRGLDQLKKNVEDKGGEYLVLANLVMTEADAYSKFKLDYEKAVLAYKREYTYVNVITKPFPADKKSYPVRWLIILGTALATFFFSVIAISILENYRDYMNKENTAKA